MFTNHDLLWPIIGQNQESVFRKLGLPSEGSFQDGDKLFMVYSDRGASTLHLLFLLPGGGHSSGDGKLISCLRIELDSDYFVKGYQVKSKNLYGNTDVHCLNIFWTEEELTELRIDPKWKEIEAEQGSTDPQLALFKNLRGRWPLEALTWLCKSADSGNPDARVILAKIFEWGGYTWIKKGIVERNYKFAYVWYALSGQYDQTDLEFFAYQYLTPKHQLGAEQALKNWQPGNCERDLGLAEPS